MKKKTETETPAPLVIENIDQLQDLVAAPMIVPFSIDGKAIHLPIRRATPAMLETYRETVRKVQPPFKAERKDYDPLDPTYLANRDAAMKKARNYLVYSCCPAVSAKKPGLTSPDEISPFVQTILTENLLDLIAASAQAGGLNLDVEVQRGANFTPPPGSES